MVFGVEPMLSYVFHHMKRSMITVGFMFYYILLNAYCNLLISELVPLRLLFKRMFNGDTSTFLAKQFRILVYAG